MDAIALACLACPYCGASLLHDGGVVRCVDGHSFDVARQGYVNLLPGNAVIGATDTAEMIDARAKFLAGGHYAQLADAVVSMLAEMPVVAGGGCIVEVGSGTGYYLARVVDSVPGRVGLALDVSVFAARRAARTHERIVSAVCDAWRSLPLHTGSVDVVLDVFAPRNAPEFARVLKPGGVLIVVTPGPRHLAEIIEPLGLLRVATDKGARVQRQLENHFALTRSTSLEYVISLGRAGVGLLAAMGPSAWHTDVATLGERILALGEETRVTVSVQVTAYRPLVM